MLVVGVGKEDEVCIGGHDLALELATQADRHHWVRQVRVEVDDELAAWPLDAEAEAGLA